MMAAFLDLHDDTDVQPDQLGRRIRAEQLMFSRKVLMQEQVDSVNLGEQFLENCINQELLAYHNLPCLPMEEKNSDDTIVYTNPLDWWKRHSHFLFLSSVAKRILCVPATSASSERVFSDAGNVITEDRTRLTPDTASALVLLKHWDKIEDMLKSHL
jgi:hypothetical protein